MRLVPYFALLTIVPLLSGSGIATAEVGPAVVELFSSEGCSSCPPAEAYTAELGQRTDVLALKLHVTNWDNLVGRTVLVCRRRPSGSAVMPRLFVKVIASRFGCAERFLETESLKWSLALRPTAWRCEPVCFPLYRRAYCRSYRY